MSFTKESSILRVWLALWRHWAYLLSSTCLLWGTSLNFLPVLSVCPQNRGRVKSSEESGGNGRGVCVRRMTESGLAIGSEKEQTVTSAAIIFGRKISTFSEAPHFTGKVHVSLAHLGLSFQPVSLKALSVLRLRTACFEEEPK